jgi:hypothetical protein
MPVAYERVFDNHMPKVLDELEVRVSTRRGEKFVVIQFHDDP